jgi:hypothetical protein
MGLDRRRRSGKIIAGSTIIVPGQDVYAVKVFTNSFQFKRGSSRELIKEFNPPKPIPPTPPPPPEEIIKAILVDDVTFLAVEDNVYFTYVE